MALPVKEVKEIASELISLLGVEAKIAVEEAEEILNELYNSKIEIRSKELNIAHNALRNASVRTELAESA